MVLIRRLISLHLKMKAKVGSSKLYLGLETFNDALLNDIKNRQYNQQMEQDQSIENENILLHNALKLFSFVGLQDPLRKIYLTERTPQYLPLVLTITLMTQVH
jgi:WASH complex subunit strumpellin